jgi:hypothetical protein
VVPDPLHERFWTQSSDGRWTSPADHPAGINDSPPYLQDGRCLTLEDTVEFFNLVLDLKLSGEEKADFVAFLRQP